MNVIKQVGSSAKQNAKQIAKQMAREPFEILKAAGKQIGVTPEAGSEKRETREAQGQQEQKPAEPTPQEKQKKAIQSQRLMQAYENELKEIEQKKKQEEVQVKQEEILEEQQKTEHEEAKKENILQVVSKKGRRMFGNIGLKREQTKVEMRQPPSS